MLKVSLIGCGGIGAVHAKVISCAKDTVFLSCCDEKMQRAEEFAKSYSIKPYNSLKDLLDADKPDILHICTGHYSHVPLALYALKNGVHVVLEKPAAYNITELELLVKHAQLSNKQIGICFQNRYNASSKMAYELIASGKTGKVLGARGIVTWSRKEKYYSENDWRGSINTEGGGVMINQAIHTLDLMQWLMGDPIKVEASTSNRTLKGIINVEDTAEAYFEFKNGANGLFYATNANAINDTISLEIYCEKMNINISGMDIFISYPDGATEKPELISDSVAFGKNYWGNGHEDLILDFYKCITENQPFWIDAKEGCRALTTMFKMYESSASNK